MSHCPLNCIALVIFLTIIIWHFTQPQKRGQDHIKGTEILDSMIWILNIWSNIIVWYSNVHTAMSHKARKSQSQSKVISTVVTDCDISISSTATCNWKDDGKISGWRLIEHTISQSHSTEPNHTVWLSILLQLTVNNQHSQCQCEMLTYWLLIGP